MYRRHGNKLGLVFLVCDLTVTSIVWFGAYFLRFLVLASPDGVPDFHLVARALPLVLLLAAVAYRLCGLYEIHRLRHRIQCDLYYISHWSLWLDLKILFLTLRYGWRHRNAY